MRSYLKIPSLIMDGRRHSCGIIIFSNCQEFLEISIKRKSGIRVTVASKPHYSSQWINVSCLSKRYIHLFSACFAPFSVFCCKPVFLFCPKYYIRITGDAASSPQPPGRLQLQAAAFCRPPFCQFAGTDPASVVRYAWLLQLSHDQYFPIIYLLKLK